MYKPHISISDDLKERIVIFQNENNYKYLSEAIVSLVEKALLYTNEDKQLNKILSSVDRVNSRTVYIRDLIEQLYSNLEIETNTNPKNNESLRQFKNKYYKDNFND